MMSFRVGEAQWMTGGRRSARRLVASATAACALLLSAHVAATERTGGPDVAVTETNGVYTVSARFTVRQSAAAAQAVLTDYDRIPRFMPDVRSSTVVERTEGRVVVEQIAVARVMMFSRRVHLLLEVAEEPGIIRFRDRSGKSFSQYEGAWLLTEGGGTTVITYQLTAQPTFHAPEFVIKRLLKRDAVRMVEGLQTEIARSAGQSASTRPGSDRGQTPGVRPQTR